MNIKKFKQGVACFLHHCSRNCLETVIDQKEIPISKQKLTQKLNFRQHLAIGQYRVVWPSSRMTPFSVLCGICHSITCPEGAGIKTKQNSKQKERKKCYLKEQQQPIFLL